MTSFLLLKVWGWKFLFCGVGSSAYLLHEPFVSCRFQSVLLPETHTFTNDWMPCTSSLNGNSWIISWGDDMITGATRTLWLTCSEFERNNHCIIQPFAFEPSVLRHGFSPMTPTREQRSGIQRFVVFVVTSVRAIDPGEVYIVISCDFIPQWPCSSWWSISLDRLGFIKSSNMLKFWNKLRAKLQQNCQMHPYVF